MMIYFSGLVSWEFWKCPYTLGQENMGLLTFDLFTSPLTWFWYDLWPLSKVHDLDSIRVKENGSSHGGNGAFVAVPRHLTTFSAEKDKPAQIQTLSHWAFQINTALHLPSRLISIAIDIPIGITINIAIGIAVNMALGIPTLNLMIYYTSFDTKRKPSLKTPRWQAMSRSSTWCINNKLLSPTT